MQTPSAAAEDPALLRRIEALDISLFDAIASETTEEDKASLLAVQAAVRRLRGAYVYLEIGSHLGGSIVPHLYDPRCRRIYSIDKRPAAMPDERDGECLYPDNSTARMLSLLRPLCPAQVGKIETFDRDARDLDPALFREPPDLCFIDGEHTNRAVISDFEFCLSVCAPDAVIVFHDSARVYRALEFIHSTCPAPHRGIKLDGSVYAIVLGDRGLMADPGIRRLASRGRTFLWLVHLRALYQAHLSQGVRQRLKPLLRPLSTRLPR